MWEKKQACVKRRVHLWVCWKPSRWRLVVGTALKTWCSGERSAGDGNVRVIGLRLTHGRMYKPGSSSANAFPLVPSVVAVYFRIPRSRTLETTNTFGADSAASHHLPALIIGRRRMWIQGELVESGGKTPAECSPVNTVAQEAVALHMHDTRGSSHFTQATQGERGLGN